MILLWLYYDYINKNNIIRITFDKTITNNTKYSKIEPQKTQKHRKTQAKVR